MVLARQTRHRERRMWSRVSVTAETAAYAARRIDFPKALKIPVREFALSEAWCELRASHIFTKPQSDKGHGGAMEWRGMRGRTEEQLSSPVDLSTRPMAPMPSQ